MHTITLLDWMVSKTDWFGIINGRMMSSRRVFTVSPNNVYRFRVIGAQHTNGHLLSIDRHQLHVIATDGNFFERYDFIIETFNQAETEFRIRMQTLLADEKSYSAFAVLNYGGASNGAQDSPHDCTNRACEVLYCLFAMFPSGEVELISRANCSNLDNLIAFDPPPNNLLPKLTHDCTDCLQFFNFNFRGTENKAATNSWRYMPPNEPYQTSCGQYAKDQRMSTIPPTCFDENNNFNDTAQVYF